MNLGQVKNVSSHPHILLFMLGVTAFQSLPTLPSALTVSFVFGLSLLFKGGSSLFRNPFFRGLLLLGVAGLLGLSWAGLRAHWRLSETRWPERSGQDMVVTGWVSDLPHALENGSRFEFRVLDAPEGVPKNLRLAWYDIPPEMPTPSAGALWQLQVRLRPPHGLWNPNGFDYEAWLFERNIGATGSVKNVSSNRQISSCLSQWNARVACLRQTIRDRFTRILPNAPYTPVLTALAVGDQQNIAETDWSALRATGTIHLLSISGLHISMVAWLLAVLVNQLWRYFPGLCRRWPAQKAAALTALFTAWLYTILAGMSVPTLRSTLMISVVTLALLTARHFAPRTVLLLAMLAVLLWDPWAVLAVGFWLSFGAVALLAYFSAYPSKGWRVAVYTQLGLSLASLPILGYLFNQAPLLSPIANSIAIPAVSWIITPLCILSMVPGLDTLLLPWAHTLVLWLMGFLKYLTQIPHALWFPPTPPLWLALLACLGALWAMAPRGTPARPWGIIALLALVTWHPTPPVNGAFEMTVLDVGQGLAVHLRTHFHNMLFDVGPVYGRPPSPSNAGERVVLPYLASEGIDSLDMILLSHADQDHTGGAETLSKLRPPLLFLDSLPEEHPIHAGNSPHVPCAAGQRWVWDGVTFEVLWPPEDRTQIPPARQSRQMGHDNNLSCVLRVSTPSASVLITGDLESNGEAAMQALWSENTLQSTVVVAGHHGSRTASSESFIAATRPQYAIFSAGYGNAFHHPHPEILDRWTRARAVTQTTFQTGALRFKSDEPNSLIQWRSAAPRYWHTIPAMTPAIAQE